MITNPFILNLSRQFQDTAKITILIYWLLLSGCAGAIVHKQSGVITSDPSGAYASAQETGISGRSNVKCGYTPCNIEMKAGALTNWVIKVEKNGYISQQWIVPRELEDISRHFVLEKSPYLLLIEKARTEMAQDQKNYITNKIFLKTLNRLLAECEKVLESPRMNAGLFAVEANALYQEIKLEFPEYILTNLMKYVTLLVTECDRVVKNETAESVVNIKLLLIEIRGAVGL